MSSQSTPTSTSSSTSSDTRIVPCPHCFSLNKVPGLKAVQSSEIKSAKCGRCKGDLDLKSAVFSVTSAGLQKIVLNSPVPVVVDFWAPWCGPCVGFAPTFQQQASAHCSQALYLKVDTEAQPDVGSRYNIRGIPTLIYFDQEKEQNRQSGAMTLSTLKQWVQQQMNG